MLKYNSQLNSFLMIYRRKEVEKRLIDSKMSTSRIWDGVLSKIKHEVFGMEYKIDPSGKRSVKEHIKSMFSQLFYIIN